MGWGSMFGVPFISPIHAVWIGDDDVLFKVFHGANTLSLNYQPTSEKNSMFQICTSQKLIYVFSFQMLSVYIQSAMEPD